VSNGVIPSNPSADFSAVNLYDLPGATTWPITMITYFYLQKDMSGMDAKTAGLLIYFIKFILSADNAPLLTANKFTTLPTALEAYNTATLASLTTPTGMPTFTTETKATTQIWTGAGDWVVSGKRRSYDEVSRNANEAAIDALSEAVVSVEMVVAGTVSDFGPTLLAELESTVAGLAGVDASLVTATVAAASVKITFVIQAGQTGAAITAALTSSLGSTADAQTAFGSAVTVESAPTVELTNVASTIVAPSSGGGGGGGGTVVVQSSGDVPTWGIIVIAVLVVLFAILGFLTYRMFSKERAGKPIFTMVTKPSSVRPPA
jgi:hypothetical protein